MDTPSTRRSRAATTVAVLACAGALAAALASLIKPTDAGTNASPERATFQDRNPRPPDKLPSLFIREVVKTPAASHQPRRKESDPPQKVGTRLEQATAHLPAKTRSEFRHLYRISLSIIKETYPLWRRDLPDQVSEEFATRFIEEFHKYQNAYEASHEDYYDLLVDFDAKRKLVPRGKEGEDMDGLVFRDQVLAGKHPSVRLRPGEHLRILSTRGGDRYMIIPATTSELLNLKLETLHGDRRVRTERLQSLLSLAY